MGMSSEKGFEKLVAKVPLKEMSSYSTSLSSLTGGRASFIMKFASYELVPSDVQDKLIKDHGYDQGAFDDGIGADGAPLRERLHKDLSAKGQSTHEAGE